MKKVREFTVAPVGPDWWHVEIISMKCKGRNAVRRKKIAFFSLQLTASASLWKKGTSAVWFLLAKWISRLLTF